MEAAMAAKRKDDKGRLLKTGERQRNDGTYEYRYQIRGKRQSLYSSTLEGLRKLETIEYEQCLPSHEQAKRMKKLFQDGELTKDMIEEIMLEEKPNQRDRLVIRDTI
jgi:hypothetical protein